MSRTKPSPSKPSIAVTHLGCEKNRVDTEHMMGLLDTAGFDLTPNRANADYVVVNTCSFIASAREEAIRVITELEAQGKKVIIAGCLAQQYKSELLKELPTAMAVVGTGDYKDIVAVVDEVHAGKRVTKVSKEPTYLANEEVPRATTTTAPVGWLRVAEGCDFRCSFCIIPKLRGKHRSRSIESVLSEAREFAARGTKELILVSQNTTSYGVDLYGKPSLPDLVSRLAEVDIPWIRIHYAYPTGVTAELLEAMAANRRVVPYFDIPLQHAHPDILKGMKRPYQKKFTTKLITDIRDAFPNAVIRTTFIVGFPGEKREHFNYLLDFVREMEFDHVGVFCYSPEEESSSFKLAGHVREQTKEHRRDALMAAQQSISLKKNRAFIGKTVDVLIEGVEPSTKRKTLTKSPARHIGRSPRFAPEVDGMVYVTGKAKVGEIVPVRILDASVYDLYGEVER